MSDLKAKLELAEERVKQYEDRLGSDAVSAAVDREQLERRIHALTESLEKERAAHLVAESALSAARGRPGREWELDDPHGIPLTVEQIGSQTDQQKLTPPTSVGAPQLDGRPKGGRSRRRGASRL